jgi:hypothetical protein
MSKAFIATVIQNSAEITGVAANRAASDLIDAIVKEIKKPVDSRFQASARSRWRKPRPARV